MRPMVRSTPAAVSLKGRLALTTKRKWCRSAQKAGDSPASTREPTSSPPTSSTDSVSSSCSSPLT